MLDEIASETIHQDEEGDRSKTQWIKAMAKPKKESVEFSRVKSHAKVNPSHKLQDQAYE